ncbi:MULTISPECIES: PEP-CTERM sorting domain-containing protein [unclassified Tolypothrix]|uniref:PEP-CTERM sorting domain-containing protein n=1 Tax=unclassified Tolypothrix TaxID=2649714 RepID=UPI0005EAB302|nr:MULTISPECIES: PEP-CTERM sorting domain-containing protein [unclassified Tolypothrix]EKF04967.1 PEP-CTERM putative exosortase interaction domain protein [Tolypothrix sp. PCC 7601]BAY91868.1 hypothetical protein NIES3275_38960 [Microchaete diplosiphon NIES-3275]
MSKLLKSFLTGTVLTFGLAIAGAGQASAVDMKTTITADNHYGLFYGNASGNSLSFVGRNELGSQGSSGAYNWSNAETWNTNVNASDYLYLVVWDDQSVDESWIGQFEFSTGQTLLSKATDWEYMISKGANPYTLRNSVTQQDQGFLGTGDTFEGNVPLVTDLVGEIQGGNWRSAERRGANGTTPWGTIAGISQNADFLNVTTADKQQRGTSANTNYTIFRTKGSIGQLAGLPSQSVPEPSSMLGLLAFGALSAGSLVKRKSKIA